MQQESLQKTLPGPWKRWFWLVALGGVLVGAWLTNLLAQAIGWAWLELLPAVVVGIGGYGLYRRYMISYRYTLTPEALFLEQVSGNLPRVQLRIPYGRILSLEAGASPGRGPLERMHPMGQEGTLYLLVDDAQDRRRQSVFMPSPAFVEALEALRRNTAKEDAPS